MSDRFQTVLQAVLTPTADINPTQAVARLAVFDEDGNSVDLTANQETPTGADVDLTGFTAGTAGPVAATDSINEAVAKLQARIVALESA